jgi:hypothetical protein
MIRGVLILAEKRFFQNQKDMWNDPNIHEGVMTEAVVEVEKNHFLKSVGFKNY